MSCRGAVVSAVTAAQEHISPRLSPLDVAPIGWPSRWGSRLDPFLLLPQSPKSTLEGVQSGDTWRLSILPGPSGLGLLEVMVPLSQDGHLPLHRAKHLRGYPQVRTEQSQSGQRSSGRCRGRANNAGCG